MALKSFSRQTLRNRSATASVTGSSSVPVIGRIVVCDSSYNNLDDTALNPAGGYAKIVGNNFESGSIVYFNGSALTATFISSTELRIETPVITTGSYNLMVFNLSSGQGAIFLNLSVSNFPTFSTTAGSVANTYETLAISTAVAATGDTPITYSLVAGEGNLPPNITLSSNGTLSGTSALTPSTQTYTFVVQAKDAQNQDATRQFTITINTDVVDWSTPSQNATISGYEYAAISNVSLSATSRAGYGATYTADTLPTGISLSGGVISGTCNTVGTTNTVLTATSDTTGRTATRNVSFNIQQDVVTWSTPSNNASYTYPLGEAISNVALSATSAAGKSVSYSANVLPQGLSISGSSIVGTPNTAQDVTTLLTATAATTGRTSTRTISWTIQLPGDDLFRHVSLLLSGNSSIYPVGSASNNVVLDGSAVNNAITMSGNANPGTFSPYGDSWSWYFDGNGDYVKVADQAVFEVSANVDFTIEAWFNLVSLPASGNFADIVTKGAAGVYQPYYLFVNSSGSLLYYSSSSGTSWNIASAVSLGTITPGTWYHVAISREGTNTRLFLNGTLINTIANSGAALTDNNTAVAVGGRSDGTETQLRGFVSNVRIVRGTAIYTSAFTPSTTPLTPVAGTVLLLCSSDSFADASAYNHNVVVDGTPSVHKVSPFKTTLISKNYSTFFDGTGQADIVYTTSPSQSLLGSGDFTTEFWCYTVGTAPPSYGTMQHFASNQLIIRYYSTTGWQIYYNGVGQNILFAAAGTNGMNTWTHVAVTRSGTTLRMFINGTVVYTDTNCSIDFTAANVRLGRTTSSYPYYGLISNTRIVKGTALYTSNFTPTTAPLTAVSGTVLLTSNSPTLIDATGTTTHAVAGNTRPVAISPSTPSISSGVSYSANTLGGSIYFDGSGDYLTVANTSPVTFGAGDFTVEFWVYPLVVGAAMMLFSTKANGTQTGDVDIRTDYTGVTSTLIYVNAGGVSFSATYPNNLMGKWTHFALVRNAGTVKLFADGLSIGQGSALTQGTSSTGAINIGGGSGLPSAGYEGLTGYMSDIRIIKGTGLYNSNFSPMASPATPTVTGPYGTLTTSSNTVTSSLLISGASGGIVDASQKVNLQTVGDVSANTTVVPFAGSRSYYFDGNGDYLSATTSTGVIEFGTQDFTIELRVRFNADNNQYNPFIRVDGGGQLDFGFDASTNQLKYSTSTAVLANAWTPTLNTWYHVALVRSNGNAKIYVDGQNVSGAGATDTFSHIVRSSATSFKIGGSDYSAAHVLSGHISDLRITKTARYTSNFTPATGVVPAT